MKKIFFLLLFVGGLRTTVISQDSTQVSEEKEVVAPKKAKFAKATFQSTNIINLHSVEMPKKGNLQFLIAHHFGIIWNKDADAGQNFAQVFGLNSGIAHTYLSFDYSIRDNINTGLAMAGNSKFEGWLKLKLLRQQTGKKNIPVSIVWYSLVNIDALANPADTVKGNKLGWNKFSYLHQLIIARKFSPKFSLQIMPGFIHYNIIPYGINNSNNIFTMGLGGKYQLSSNKALTFEYARQFNMYKNVLDKNGRIINYSPDLLSVGLEFNTGGHVFQFYIGNTTASSAIEQLSRNSNWIKDGQFAMGFRLNRGFFIGKK